MSETQDGAENKNDNKNGNGYDESDGVDDFTSGRQFSWYLAFISIVFGIFISFWVQPLATLIDNGNTEQELINAFISKNSIRGLLAFLMLICLWWWYGTFLGRIAPARLF